jgi:hypothetical protein
VEGAHVEMQEINGTNGSQEDSEGENLNQDMEQYDIYT